MNGIIVVVVLSIVLLCIGMIHVGVEIEDDTVADDTTTTSTIASKANRVGNGKRLFVASYEWKVIESDHIVPPGLHYRMDFKTGITEAKILEADEDVMSDSGSGDNNGAELAVMLNEHGDIISHDDVDNGGKVDDSNYGVDMSSTYSKEELEHALSNMDIEAAGNSAPAAANKANNLNFTNLSSEELQQMYDWVNGKTGLIDQYHNMMSFMEFAESNDSNVVIDSLTQLKDIVDSQDLGCDWAKSGGIPRILALISNYSTEISGTAASVLGSALSNNECVQTVAMENGTFEILSSSLERRSIPYAKHIVYALGALVRHNSAAEKMFFGNHTHIRRSLAAFFDSDRMDLDNNVSLSRLQVKILTLLYDLVMESVEDVSVYESSYLIDLLVSEGWCERILFSLSSSPSPVSPTLVEIVTQSKPYCRQKYIDAGVKNIL